MCWNPEGISRHPCQNRARCKSTGVPERSKFDKEQEIDILPKNLLTKYILREKSNFTVSKFSRQHLNKLIKVTITNNGTNQSQGPRDRMHGEEASITFKDIPAKDAKLEPTCERHQTNTNQGTIIQIPGLYPSKIKR